MAAAARWAARSSLRMNAGGAAAQSLLAKYAPALVSTPPPGFTCAIIVRCVLGLMMMGGPRQKKIKMSK